MTTTGAVGALLVATGLALGVGATVAGGEAGSAASGPTAPAATGSRAASALPDAPGAGRPVERARWRWPAAPVPEVVRRFLPPASAYGPGHRGLDLGVAGAAPVLAVEAGRVTHAGVVVGRGTVTLRHRDGLQSTYEPVVPEVRVGDEVAAGERLGRLGTAPAHCGRRTCLHLGARRDGAYLDPLPFLVGGGHVRLLPLGTTGVSAR
ncbi:M23 family metallopeptidase [Phycicoccus sp. MAQZ13P-2]|uniref:murein hydrolase activator EnvC family protein n=1 Tax=Phycicoccus mangrovi TaxID=2840470 RepID=UPI001C008BEC|nr:M23 family metallopeptidase [Phycicoccus mangrovi]MBT9254375.1 M23 family metallopeptidase [Phycicoccus mangrovi]MBT9272753.1 M23 family metallopeptidase [Phycicoccus mangrovi]